MSKQSNQPEVLNTKPLPIMITLIAALISCVYSILQAASMGVFVKRLALSVLIFYVIGCVVKVILDKFAAPAIEDVTAEGENPKDDQQLQDIKVNHSDEDEEDDEE